MFAAAFLVRRFVRLKLTRVCQRYDVLSRQCAFGASLDLLDLQLAVLDDVSDAAHLCSHLLTLQGHMPWVHWRGELPLIEDGHGECCGCRGGNWCCYIIGGISA